VNYVQRLAQSSRADQEVQRLGHFAEERDLFPVNYSNFHIITGCGPTLLLTEEKPGLKHSGVKLTILLYLLSMLRMLSSIACYLVNHSGTHVYMHIFVTEQYIA
jgi:hypothetical protein